MPKKHTILYLTPSVRLLGARQSLLALTTHLDRSKFHPIVVCPQPGGLSDELIKAGIEVEFIKLYNWRKPKFLFHQLFSIYRLRKLVANRKVDIIHCNEFWDVPYAAAARGKQNIPIVAHMRLSVTPRQIKNYKLKYADKIIVVSEGSKKFFDNADESIKSRIEVVYNGVDTAAFTKGVNRNEVRSEIGLKDDDILIGHIALYSPRKRQLITLEAAKETVAQNPKCHFIFCGMSSSHLTEYEEELKKRTKEYGLESNVHIQPFRTDINKVFAALDINLLISDDEGFGRVIIEAGAFGVPSIGTLIGGIPEIIIDSETGYLIQLDDINTLTEKILYLSQNPDIRIVYGKNAQKRVHDLFTIEQHTRKIEGIYNFFLQK